MGNKKIARKFGKKKFWWDKNCREKNLQEHFSAEKDCREQISGGEKSLRKKNFGTKDFAERKILARKRFCWAKILTGKNLAVKKCREEKACTLKTLSGKKLCEKKFGLNRCDGKFCGSEEVLAGKKFYGIFLVAEKF